jgi:putative lipoprotein
MRINIPSDKLALIIVPVILCIFSGCASVHSKQNRDDWFGRDKAEHFVISAAIGAVSGTKLKNNGSSKCGAAAGGITISLVAGSGKEYYDKYIRKKYWSWKDMFWNFIGGTAGSLAATGCL